MEKLKKIFLTIIAFINKIGSWISWLFAPVRAVLSKFINKHRAFVVRRFALSYETKILGRKPIGGKTGKHLRAVIPSLLTFYFAILSTLIIDNLGWWEVIKGTGIFSEVILTVLFTAFYFIFWTPFIVVLWIGKLLFGKGYFDYYPIKYDELDNPAQRFQLLGKPPGTGMEDESFPVGFEFQKLYQDLARWHHAKFGNSANVNVLLGLAPFAILIGGFVLAYLLML